MNVPYTGRRKDPRRCTAGTAGIDAITDALRPSGITQGDMPASAHCVWQALCNAPGRNAHTAGGTR